jgi:hypothetical protein
VLLLGGGIGLLVEHEEKKKSVEGAGGQTRLYMCSGRSVRDRFAANFPCVVSGSD